MRKLSSVYVITVEDTIKFYLNIVMHSSCIITRDVFSFQRSMLTIHAIGLLLHLYIVIKDL